MIDKNGVKLAKAFEEAERFIIVTKEEKETIQPETTAIEVVPIHEFLLKGSSG